MGNIDIKKSKYSSWEDEYNFQNCKLKRGDYGQFILDYLTSEKNGFVLNINGSWGTGKTNFVRRLYTEALGSGYPSIYIDAWESDFTESPLTVVTSELISQLNDLNSNIGSHMDSLKEGIGRIIKTAAIFGTGFLTKTLMDDGTIGVEAAKSLLKKEDIIEHIDFVNSAHQDQVNSIISIRENLSSLAEVLQTNYSTSLPVIVIIDELDRCRPNYAVEMLEVVKHFFQTKNFVFVIASDTEQLQYSIKTIYGSEFDSRRYLKRFFDREARIPKPKINDYINVCGFDFTNHLKTLNPFPSGLVNKDIVYYISVLSYDYGLEIRDIDQVINKTFSCLAHIESLTYRNSKYYKFDILLLIIAIIENHTHCDSYNNRTSLNQNIYKVVDSDVDRDRLSANIILELSVKFNSEYRRYDSSGYGSTGRANITRSIEEDLPSYRHQEGFSKQTATLSTRYHNSFYHDNPNEGIWLKWENYRGIVDLAGNLT